MLFAGLLLTRLTLLPTLLAGLALSSLAGLTLLPGLLALAASLLSALARLLARLAALLTLVLLTAFALLIHVISHCFFLYGRRPTPRQKNEAKTVWFKVLISGNRYTFVPIDAVCSY